VKLRFAVAGGLTTAVLATAGISAALAQGTTGTTGGLSLGRDCTTLTLTGGHQVAGFTVPTVCLIRDSSGKRFYLFSGVFRYLAGRRSVQATFPVSNALPLHGSTIVPVVGFVGRNPANTYAGWGQIRPDGQISIHGPKPGWIYTVTISGQIPIDVPAGP
jgi:hypothetical protein